MTCSLLKRKDQCIQINLKRKVRQQTDHSGLFYQGPGWSLQADGGCIYERQVRLGKQRVPVLPLEIRSCGY